MKLLVLLFLLYSSCLAHFDTEWWKHTIIYELVPYSFKDSDGDGIGDIKGITSKLDYLEELGIETLHLTPVFESPFIDMGYDITDFCKIAPRYGTMADFDELVRELKKRNMKLILDLVLNHSSNKHEWFQKSIDRIDPYTDFYVWKNSKGFDNDTQKEISPNKWISLFKWLFGDLEPGTAWKWNEKRKQFYFHHFLEEQPDFNLRNEVVKEELKKIMKFWLDKGVSGFRLDAASFLIEDEELRDDRSYLRMYNQNETFEFIHEFRLFLNEYNEKYKGPERIFVAEVHAQPPTLLKYYDRGDYQVTHFPYTFSLEYLKEDIDAEKLENLIEPWIKMLPEKAVAAWVINSHDENRVGTRIRPEYSDIFTIISMTLPGTAVCYYGQEIAMLNGYITKDQIKDISGKGTRDPARLPMQWDDSLNAGFSKNITSTYLPVNGDYFIKNVEYQKKQHVSHYQMFKDLSTLRKTDTLKFGDFKNYVPSNSVYIFTRSYKHQMYIIITNLSSLPSRVNLNKEIADLPQELSVITASVNAKYDKGTKVENEQLNEFVLRPMSSVVLEGYF